MTIAFVGHSVIPYGDKVKELVKEQLRSSIVKAESVTCYLGGYGDFDSICACKELKGKNINFKVVYVTPYITFSEQAKIKEMQKLGLCDASIYPPIENTPPKFAISKKQMDDDNCKPDHCICNP